MSLYNKINTFPMNIYYHKSITLSTRNVLFCLPSFYSKNTYFKSILRGIKEKNNFKTLITQSLNGKQYFQESFQGLISFAFTVFYLHLKKTFIHILMEKILKIVKLFNLFCLSIPKMFHICHFIIISLQDRLLILKSK